MSVFSPHPTPHTTLLQWNSQGLRNKKDELASLIQLHSPSVIGIQETKFHASTSFSLPHFSCIRRDGHFNVTSHGGVALFIHESIPFRPLHLACELQAVAAVVQLRTPTSICCVYASRSHPLTRDTLLEIINALPPPLIIMGDFNSYNTLWGCDTTDARGRLLENALIDCRLIVLNNGTPTRISYQSESAIDLTIASPRLTPDIEWSVSASPEDSDHCPILISLLDSRPLSSERFTWNLKRANWPLYSHHAAWETLDALRALPYEQQLPRFTDLLLLISTECIPQFRLGRFFPKPYWTRALTESRLLRERLYRRYRRNRSLHNATLWKRARAQHRALLKREKRASWITFANSFTTRTPLSTVYANTRKLKGKPQRAIHILTHDNQTYSTVPAIADKLASTFSAVSRSTNYSPQFLEVKAQAERHPLDFTSSTSADYNSPFTLEELHVALSSAANTSPGPDGVHYSMLQHMPPAGNQFLLDLFESFWQNHYFPPQWRTAHVIPIPKPGKSPSHPDNYRPIALTSCLCKTLERMINNRLYEYCTMNGHFANIQCGGRRGRSTIDHLVRLETFIRRAFVRDEHVISVFFDLRKAYDTTWKYGILRDLHSIGLRGLLPLYIQQFLRDRTFRVLLNNHLSAFYPQEESVPQGAVLSVTLFTLKINQLAAQIPPDLRFHASLFVDDLQVGYRHSDLAAIHGKLQECIDAILRWTNANGFSFSSSKSKAMLFTLNPPLLSPPSLHILADPVAYVDSFRFLGLLWDRKLTFRPHVLDLIDRCKRMIQLFRSIASHEWGADQRTLLHLYKLFVRSKLDYGSIVYASACPSTLLLLDPLANDCLRLATGAFKSTPIPSLQVLAAEMPLSLRRQVLSLRYYFKLKGQLGNPAHRYVVPPVDRRLFSAKRLTPPFGIRTLCLIEDTPIPTDLLAPAFSYRLLRVTKPTWLTYSPVINLDLSRYPKVETPAQLYLHECRRILADTFSTFTKVFTDGSKGAAGVGSAACCRAATATASLPRHASIYSAELHAITLALALIRARELGSYLILTDSLSSLQSLADKHSQHPTVRKLQHDLDALFSTGRTVAFFWIPSHVGIQGNELVDRLAKAASAKPPEPIRLHYTDWFPVIREVIQQRWAADWRRHRGLLTRVRDTPGPWASNISPRRAEVVVNRLRSGHTWLTHNYLMDNAVLEPPPICPMCDSARLTVQHLLLDCDELNRARTLLLFDPRTPAHRRNLQSLLGDDVPVVRLVAYLRHIGAYDSI